MTAYTVTSHEPPTVVCPPWCIVPVDQHLGELRNWEGYVLHWSSDREIVDGVTARLSLSATPSGTPDHDSPYQVDVDRCRVLNPEEARVVGEALVALSREAYAT